MTRPLPVLALASSLIATFAAHEVRADSGRLHLHLDVGVGGAATGASSYQSFGDGRSLGAIAALGLDYQLHAPFALEAAVHAGGFSAPFPNSGVTGAAFSGLSIGARVRLLDDRRGYLGERGGNAAGNLWVAAHVGWYAFDGGQYGVDAAVGYALSVHRPISIGPMARAYVLPGGGSASVDVVVTGGVELTFEVMRASTRGDQDGDGLSDDEEARVGTNPRSADTDGDEIPDQVEIDTHTDPTSADTDGDGLADGYEDEDGNGLLDLDETDPRNFDTDGGGVSDGDEVFSQHTDPRNPRDDDRDADGVPNTMDHCEATAAGTQVDSTGCPVRTVHVTVTSIAFVAGRMRVSPDGASALDQLAATLTGAPVEIVVYVRPTGDAGVDSMTAQRRADAIGTYLAEHGVARERFTLRAAGADPTEGRTTDPNLARLEVRRP